MSITEDQIEFISKSLAFHGLQNQRIKEDILDHICTTIEASAHTDFTLAYKEAIQKLGGYSGIKELQKETDRLIYVQTMLRTKKGLYISGFVMVFILSIGLIFKLFHWPFANILLVLGFSVLLLVYVPLLFYMKYKQSIINYQS